ncbi:MAG: hemerythrin family protein [Methylococcales bacterium]|nr:hemerythrin family protein [Methylococcales bacterium]
MKVCEWNQDYSVGITTLDKHHKKLFEILNKLFTLMDEGSEDAPILKVIDELMDYTHYHFEQEEAMMAKIAYPDLEQHKVLHKELIDQLNGFAKEAQNGMAIFVAIKIATVGLEWLKNHIFAVDYKYHEYIKAQGIEVNI